MKITFKRNKLKKIFSDFSLLEKNYGSDRAFNIVACVNILEVVDNIEVLLEKKYKDIHKLKGNRKSQYAINIGHPFRLIIEILNDNQKQVVKIIGVEDYH